MSTCPWAQYGWKLDLLPRGVAAPWLIHLESAITETGRMLLCSAGCTQGLLWTMHHGYDQLFRHSLIQCIPALTVKGLYKGSLHCTLPYCISYLSPSQYALVRRSEVQEKCSLSGHTSNLYLTALISFNEPLSIMESCHEIWITLELVFYDHWVV